MKLFRSVIAAAALVAAGSFKTLVAADVKTGSVASVEGSMLSLRKDASGVTVDGAKVTAADIAATNGVIHVIDTVIIPN